MSFSPAVPMTDYLAPFSLWLCKRCRPGGDTLPVELARPDRGPESGPLMFVSRLHAHLYATLRNRGEAAGDAWQCLPLQSFGLREHIRALGGRIDCELAYGFMSDKAGALVVADGAPRVRFLELSFEVDDDIDDPLFGFNQWAFEFMREEWSGIGASSLHATFDWIDESADVAFARLVDTALSRATLTRHDPDVEHWSVYEPRAGRWIGAPADVRLNMLTLH